MIALRHIHDRQWPRDANPGLVEPDSTLGFRRIRSSVQVQKLALRFHRLKAVRASLRNDEHSCIRWCELFRMPFQEGRRSASQVDGNVEDATSEAADQLHFSARRMLIMKTTYC